MESRNIAKASTYCFAGERDSQETNYTFGVVKEGYDKSEEVIHDMQDFNARMVSNIKVTTDDATRVESSMRVRQQEIASMVSMLDHQDITDHIEYKERNTFVSSK